MGKYLWVVKVYFMAGVGLDMVTYFRGVTALMLFYAFYEVSAGLANIKGFTRTIKTVCSTTLLLIRWIWRSS